MKLTDILKEIKIRNVNKPDLFPQDEFWYTLITPNNQKQFIQTLTDLNYPGDSLSTLVEILDNINIDLHIYWEKDQTFPGAKFNYDYIGVDDTSYDEKYRFIPFK